MIKPKLLKGQDRMAFLERLEAKYGNHKAPLRRALHVRKKYAWMFVVGLTKIFKRGLDIVVSSVLLIIGMPLFFLLALLIKLEDGGSVFFVQPRVGKWGREFAFPKFRTMRVGADLEKKNLRSDEDDPKRFKMKEDPRVTDLGIFLRRTSLDELPQLWCVLKGDMSLVGPRPPLPHEVEHYTVLDRKRLDIVPGLTGLSQVSGRSETPYHKQLRLDLEYIESQSFLLDLKLLLKTIPAVFLGKGAY